MSSQVFFTGTSEILTSGSVLSALGFEFYSSFGFFFNFTLFSPEEERLVH